jgi:hypothetical protein
MTLFCLRWSQLYLNIFFSILLMSPVALGVFGTLTRPSGIKIWCLWKVSVARDGFWSKPSSPFGTQIGVDMAASVLKLVRS